MIKSLGTNRYGTWVKRHKWWLIAGLIICMISAVTAIYFASVKYWDGYRTAYMSMTSSSKTQLDAALALPVEKYNDKIAALKQVGVALQRTDSQCSNSALVRWQSALPYVKRTIDTCHQQVAQLKKITTAVKAVTDHIESIDRVTMLLAATPISAEVEDVTIPEVAQSWADVTKKVQSVAVVNSAIPVKESAEKVATSIHTSWAALSQASVAKDRTKYESAKGAVADAYAITGNVSTAAATSMKPLIKSLEQSYAATYQ